MKFSSFLNYSIIALRGSWRRVPLPARKFFWRFTGQLTRNVISKILIGKPHVISPADRINAPLVVAGLFSTANGIGEACRATYSALSDAGLEPIAVDLSHKLASVDLQPQISFSPMPSSKTGTLILQLNAPETLSALQNLKIYRERQWHIIGYWAWELPIFPIGWEKAFPFLTEIWTISKFSSEAIEQHNKVIDVKVFHHCIRVPDEKRLSTISGLTDKFKFSFLVMCDALSSLERKNPFAAIKAFKLAFSEKSNIGLILKVRNMEFHEKARGALLELISGVQNIILIEDTLSDDEKWNLLNTIDCYVSLHRAEGFGLTLAECMALGKPVIATKWSGNMDFMNSYNSYLIEPEFISCEDPYMVYSNRKTMWADICIKQAMLAMQRVVSDVKMRDSISKKAKSDIAKQLSPEKIGLDIKNYLYI